MDAQPLQDWSDPHARFEIVFEAVGARELRVLRSAPDGDRATLAFYDEWERLTHDHATGHLLLVCHNEEACTLLRQPVGRVAHPRYPPDNPSPRAE
jgi:hypothetical protein